jgi:hypothetical protein
MKLELLNTENTIMVNFIQFISGLTNEVEIFDLEELESFWNDFSLQFEDMKPDERNTKS